MIFKKPEMLTDFAINDEAVMYLCVYLGAVRKTQRFNGITDHEIRLKCASFFTNSRDRKNDLPTSAVTPDPNNSDSD